MKSMTARLLPALMLVFASPLVWATAGDPTFGIPSTAHDFSGAGPFTGGATGATTGTCTYCHTPHRAGSQALLWNQQPPGGAPTSYSWVGSTVTTGGTDFATITVASNNGPSVKCLSCHDGTAGFGDMGWFDAVDPPTGESTLPAMDTINVTNQVAANNMSGNHPVSMPFPLLGALNTYNGVSSGGAAQASDWVGDPEAVGIRLFSDTGGGTGISAGSNPGTTGIECSSCHDPHNGATATGPFFLRGLIGTNTTEYICAKCHNR